MDITEAIKQICNTVIFILGFSVQFSRQIIAEYHRFLACFNSF